MSVVKPAPIALVVCDSIYSEPNGKTALVGLFNFIAAVSFPAIHPRMAIFASVTGLRPGSTAQIKIIHAETEHCVLSAGGPFDQKIGPVDVADLSIICDRVVFPEAGQYDIQFWCNEHLLMMRPFFVTKVENKKNV